MTGDKEFEAVREKLRAEFQRCAAEIARINTGDLLIKDADPLLLRRLAQYVSMEEADRVATALERFSLDRQIAEEREVAYRNEYCGESYG